MFSAPARLPRCFRWRLLLQSCWLGAFRSRSSWEGSSRPPRRKRSGAEGSSPVAVRLVSQRTAGVASVAVQSARARRGPCPRVPASAGARGATGPGALRAERVPEVRQPVCLLPSTSRAFPPSWCPVRLYKARALFFLLLSPCP